MGLYARYIFPRLMERALDRPEAHALRRRALAQASPPLLELGFGTGLNLEAYPEAISEITAIDDHTPCLGFVRRRMERARVKVRFETGDVARLPVDDGAYATVVSTWLLCSVRDPRAVLSEVRRVLRPNGLYLFVEHGLSKEPAQRRHQERLTPMTRITACGCTLTRPIPQLVEAAGFELLSLGEFDIPSVGRASGHLFAGVARPRPPDTPVASADDDR